MMYLALMILIASAPLYAMHSSPQFGGVAAPKAQRTPQLGGVSASAAAPLPMAPKQLRSPAASGIISAALHEPADGEGADSFELPGAAAGAGGATLHRTAFVADTSDAPLNPGFGLSPQRAVSAPGFASERSASGVKSPTKGLLMKKVASAQDLIRRAGGTPHPHSEGIESIIPDGACLVSDDCPDKLVINVPAKRHGEKDRTFVARQVETILDEVAIIEDALFTVLMANAEFAGQLRKLSNLDARVMLFFPVESMYNHSETGYRFRFLTQVAGPAGQQLFEARYDALSFLLILT